MFRLSTLRRYPRKQNLTSKYSHGWSKSAAFTAPGDNQHVEKTNGNLKLAIQGSSLSDDQRTDLDSLKAHLSARPNERNIRDPMRTNDGGISNEVSHMKLETTSSPLNKALHARNLLLRRIASENLYDIVRGDPKGYFSKAPFIDPNEGFQKADILKKLHASNFELDKLSPNDLKKAFKLNMVDIDDFLWDTPVESEPSHHVNTDEPTNGIGHLPTEEIPWELLAMRSELQAMLRGDPSLDQAESILKGKHITDPREFTSDDLHQIREWDKEFRERELLECVLQTQSEILKVDENVSTSFSILQKTKQTVLEDNEYQRKVAELQHESQQQWENFTTTKSARPWKALAADRFPFYNDPSSRVPKHGGFNIGPLQEEAERIGSSGWKKNRYTHYRVLRGRELRNSSRHALTKKYS
ncbi:hypothetical protein XU18_1207 [Perkinsela sp. CCAP 1560/4]|nr:hypothetical protein XU18_1207 [Perkinsela sp. CCAP 1560/4]|eukprot:KNH08199.1 hypothetical protein XU18_1207 [Perkinsela sp. CCAP 1560/4]